MDAARFAAPGANAAGPSQPPQPQRPPAKKRARNSPDGPGRSATGSTGAGDLSKVRAFAACRACRQKKVKCLPGPQSGVNGNAACQQCIMSGAECEYQPTRDRAAYSRAYVQDLSGRVQQLEALQSRILPLLNAFEGGKLENFVSGLAAKPEPQSMSDNDERDMNGDSRPHSPRGDDDDDEGRRFQQDDRGNFRWIGPSNTLSLLDSFDQEVKAQPSRVTYRPVHDSTRASSPADSAHPYFGPVAGAGVIRALPGVEEVTFPPRADAEAMVDAYFAEVHPVLPVLLEPDFRRRLNRALDCAEAGDFGSIRAGFLAVVFAVFALGERVLVTSRAWQRERAKQRNNEPEGETIQPGDAEAGVIWFERSQVLHFSSYREVDLYQVQCLTLQSAFQSAVNDMPMSWLLASQALRVAQDIGLHFDAPRFKVSLQVKQLGARVWWSVYGLERLISITLGRPVCVDDQDMDISYPLAVDDETLFNLGEALTEEAGNLPEEPADCTMSGFVALTKLCKIAGRVAQLLYRPNHSRSISDQQWAEKQQQTIDKLDRLLRDWLQNEVPQKYKDASSSRPISLMSAALSNGYFAVLLTLHRNLLPSNPAFARPRPNPSSQSLAHCVDAARSVIHVATQSRVLVPVSHHLAVFCQYLWSSAVILLLCETRAREQIVIDAVGAHVESCHQALRALEPVWPGCRKLRQLLTEVEARAKQVRAAAARPKKRPSSKDRSNSAKKVAGGAAAPNAAPTQNWQQAPQAPPLTASQVYSLSHGGVNNPALAPGLDGTFNLFDVGDMNFDGLEMLNAFTSDAWAVPATQSPLEVGSNTGQTPTSTGPAAPGQGQSQQSQSQSQSQQSQQSQQQSQSMPAPSAPANGSLGNMLQPSPGGPRSRILGSMSSDSSAPIGAGLPSPNTSTANTANWFTAGLGQSAAAPSPGPAPSELAEMWAQIAGNSFDWGADPSVPFQI